MEEADLPDPEQVLADPDGFELPERGDRAYAALTSVAAAVAADPTPDRWASGWRAFGKAAGAAPTSLRPRPGRWRGALLEKCVVPELGRLLIHLCAHLIRDHAARPRALGVADENRRGHWNRAADAEINDDLAADALMPSCACDRPVDLGCDDGGLAEQYYADANRRPRRWDCGSGC